MFGVPMDGDEGSLEDHLMPVMPRNLRHLILRDDAFDPGSFDPAVKQQILASILTCMKSERSIRETSRWNVVPNCHPESSKYSGPPGIRLK